MWQVGDIIELYKPYEGTSDDQYGCYKVLKVHEDREGRWMELRVVTKCTWNDVPVGGIIDSTTDDEFSPAHWRLVDKEMFNQLVDNYYGDN